MITEGNNMPKEIELRTNLDWAGEFQTMAERMRLCESEEQMYRQLQKFKEEFRDMLIGQEYINKCKNGRRTGLFHSQGNKSTEASSERTEFIQKRICLQEIIVLLHDQIQLSCCYFSC